MCPNSMLGYFGKDGYVLPLYLTTRACVATLRVWPGAHSFSIRHTSPKEADADISYRYWHKIRVSHVVAWHEAFASAIEPFNCYLRGTSFWRFFW
jgi:hypothetical protein